MKDQGSDFLVADQAHFFIEVLDERGYESKAFVEACGVLPDSVDGGHLGKLIDRGQAQPLVPRDEEVLLAV